MNNHLGRIPFDDNNFLNESFNNYHYTEYLKFRLFNKQTYNTQIMFLARKHQLNFLRTFSTTFFKQLQFYNKISIYFKCFINLDHVDRFHHTYVHYKILDGNVHLLMLIIHDDESYL